VSYSLTIIDPATGEKEPFTLDNSAAWRALCEWGSTLPDDGYGEFGHLCNFGWTRSPGLVAVQVQHALEIDRDDLDPDVVATAEYLIGIFDGRPDEEEAIVTE